MLREGVHVAMKRVRIAWIAAAVMAVSVGAAAGQSQLVEAAKRGDKAAIRALLKRGTPVNEPYGDGAIALHWAVHRDDLEMVDQLIAAGANVNAADDLGVTPLWLACTDGSASVVDRLLKAGANPNAALANGETPLMGASHVGNLGSVRLLLARGANVNAKEAQRGQTALMWAAAQHHPQVVEALIELGADVHARSNSWPMTVNVGLGTTRDAILDNDESAGVVKIQQGGYTPLLFAAQRGDIESARLLLAAGADVNDTAPMGASALVIAAHSGNGAFGAFLLDKGANPDAAEAGYTALHAAILRRDVELVKALMAHGASPHVTLAKATPDRRSSSDYALGMSLIGATPFWLAARMAEPQIMRVLVASGAEPHFVLTNLTPLMATMEPRMAEGNFPVSSAEGERLTLEAIKAAVELGLDVNEANSVGQTALHTATYRGLNSVVQYLVEKSARIDVKNKKGQTALSIALTASRTSTAELLRKLGAKE